MSLSFTAVNALGRIDFLRTAFHNKRQLWPLGYSATRTIVLHGRAIECLCEIASSPDTTTPVFRYLRVHAFSLVADALCSCLQYEV
jgi:hypothetical protein